MAVSLIRSFSIFKVCGTGFWRSWLLKTRFDSVYLAMSLSLLVIQLQWVVIVILVWLTGYLVLLILYLFIITIVNCDKSDLVIGFCFNNKGTFPIQFICSSRHVYLASYPPILIFYLLICLCPSVLGWAFSSRRHWHNPKALVGRQTSANKHNAVILWLVHMSVSEN